MDLALGIDGRGADPTGAESGELERVSPAVEGECPMVAAGIADGGALHLAHPDEAAGLLALQGWRWRASCLDELPPA